MNKRKNDFVLDQAREKQRFSIRKLSIGAASVLLGTFLFWGSTSTAQAAKNPAINTENIVSKSSSDNSTDSASLTFSTENQQQKVVSKTDSTNGSSSVDMQDKQSSTNNQTVTVAASDSKKQGASTDDTQKAKSDEDAAKESIADNDSSETVNVASLEKSAGDPAESKAASRVKSSVKVTDDTTNTEVTSSEDNPKKMTAGKDVLDVDVNLTNLTSADKNITMTFDGIGSSAPLKVSADTNGSQSDGNWKYEISTGTTSSSTNVRCTWMGEDDPSELNFSLPISGNKAGVAANTTEDAQVSVSAKNTDNETIVDPKTILYAKVTNTSANPAIQDGEIVRVFSTDANKTVASERDKLSDDDYNALLNADKLKAEDSGDPNKLDDRRVAQYGMYLNYNAYKDLQSALENAKFQIQLKGNQTLMPNSFRAFKVPKQITIDGETIDIVNPKTGELQNLDKYYSYITSSSNNLERPALEQYLKDSITSTVDGEDVGWPGATPNDVDKSYAYFTTDKSSPDKSGNVISVDQTGKFTIPGWNLEDEDPANTAYFIQFDTFVTELHGDATLDSNYISYSYGNHEGPSVSFDNSGKISISGEGQGKNHQEAIVRYYDDTAGKFINPSDVGFSSTDDYQANVYGKSDTNIDFTQTTLDTDKGAATSTSVAQDIFGIISNYKDTNGNVKYKYGYITSEGYNSGTPTSTIKLLKNKIYSDNNYYYQFADPYVYGQYDSKNTSKTGDSNPQYFVVHFNVPQQEAVIRFYDDTTKQFISPTDVGQNGSDQYAVDVYGDTGDYIGFSNYDSDTEAETIFKDIRDYKETGSETTKYKYAYVTSEGNNSGDPVSTVKKQEGENYGNNTYYLLADHDIYGKFDDSKNDENGFDMAPQYFVVHFTNTDSYTEAKHHTAEKTITRVVHHYIEGTTIQLLPDTIEKVHLKQDYYTDDAGNAVTTKSVDGKTVVDQVLTGDNAKAAEAWKIDGDAQNAEANKPLGENNSFQAVNDPTITLTTGDNVGTWIKVDAENNKEFGPALEGHNVPSYFLGDMISNAGDNNDTNNDQEYTLYYNKVGHTNALDKTITRTVNYYQEGTTNKLKDTQVDTYAFHRDACYTYKDKEGTPHYGTYDVKTGKFTTFKNDAQPALIATKTSQIGDQASVTTELDSATGNSFDSITQRNINNDKNSTYPEGNWIQVDANGNDIADNGLDVKSFTIVPEGKDAFTDKTELEANLYYVQEATEHQDSKTIKRTVHFKTSDNQILKDDTTETVSFTKHYFTAKDKNGKDIFVNAKKLKNDTWVVDYDNATTPADDSWISAESNLDFASVDLPTITDGLLPGTWTKVSASKDSEYGPNLDGLKVQGDKVSDLRDNALNDQNQEYTLVYSQVPEEHKDSKTITRVVHHYIEGTTTKLLPDTTESTTFAQHYYTIKGKNGKEVVVSVKTVKNAKGEDVLVVKDVLTGKDAKDAKAWSISGSLSFTQVDDPEITDGLLSGDWIRTNAVKNSTNASDPAVIDNKIVPESTLASLRDLANGTAQEYTIFYSQVPEEHKDSKTITRVVHHYIEGTTTKLLPDTTETITFTQHYYTNKDGNVVITKEATNAKGKKVQVVDRKATDDEAKLLTAWQPEGNTSFAQVDDPEITDGLVSGDWIRTNAVKNSTNASDPAVIDNEIVPESTLASLRDLNNGTAQEYTIYYSQIPEEHKDSKTITRVVHYYIEGTTTKLLPDTTESTTFTQHYYTDEDGNVIITKEATNTKGEKVQVVDRKATNDEAKLLTAWQPEGNTSFAQVDDPEITDGLVSGDWIRVNAVKNSTNESDPAVIDNKIVPESTLASLRDLANGTKQEYTIYYNTPDQPTQPTEPTNPTNPTTPPVHPVTPSEPTTPENPTSPESPTTSPVHPVTPSDEPEKPGTPTTPSKSTDEVIPPVHGQSMTEHAEKTISTAQKTSSSKQTETPAPVKRNSSENNELPQTGAKDNNLGIIGLAIAAVAGLFGIASTKKRKDN